MSLKVLQQPTLDAYHSYFPLQGRQCCHYSCFSFSTFRFTKVAVKALDVIRCRVGQIFYYVINDRFILLLLKRRKYGPGWNPERQGATSATWSTYGGKCKTDADWLYIELKGQKAESR
jgi:hypothetical protein